MPTVVSIFGGMDGYEGDDPAEFEIQRDDTTQSLDVRVSITTKQDDMIIGVENRMISFAAGESRAKTSVSIVDDFIANPNRTLELEIIPPSGAPPIIPVNAPPAGNGEPPPPHPPEPPPPPPPPPTGPSYTVDPESYKSVVDIIDDEDDPYVEIYHVADAVDGMASGYFRLRRTDINGDLMVQYNLDTARSTATSGSDFTPFNGYVQFMHGQEYVEIPVDVMQTQPQSGEGIETVAINLISATRMGGGTVPVSENSPMLQIIPPIAGPVPALPTLTTASVYYLGWDTPAGTLVGMPTAQLNGLKVKKFEIVGGNAAGYFDIDAADGTVTLKKPYEHGATVPSTANLAIRVTDSLDRTANATMAIEMRNLVIIYGDTQATKKILNDEIDITIRRTAYGTGVLSNAQGLTVYFKLTLNTVSLTTDIELGGDDDGQYFIPQIHDEANNIWKVTIPANVLKVKIAYKVKNNATIDNGVETFNIQLQDSPTTAVPNGLTYVALNNMTSEITIEKTEKKIIKFRGERNLTCEIYEGLTVFASENSELELVDKRNGVVVASGVHENDIKQNQLGDCWMLNALLGIIKWDPAFIGNAIQLIDGDTNAPKAKVRFYDGLGEKFFVVPLNLDRGNLVALMSGDQNADHKSEIWVAVIEKAYAVFRGVDVSKVDDFKIEDFWTHFTNVPWKSVAVAEYHPPADGAAAHTNYLNKVTTAMNNSKAVLLWSNGKPAGAARTYLAKNQVTINVGGQPKQYQRAKLYYNHAYFLVKIEAGIAYVRNTHNRGYGEYNQSEGLLVIDVNELPDLFNGANILPKKDS